jgi:sec-independent protein translocase protein TatA
MFNSFGAPELLIVLAIVVVLFGATRIGDIGKGIGRGIKEFRREIKDGQEEQPAAKAESSDAPPAAANVPDDKRSQVH